MLPKFSLRIILLIVTAAAGVSAVLARAVAGDSWAIGVSAAFGWAVLALLIHAVFYLAAIALSGLGDGSQATRSASKAEEHTVD